MYARRHGTTSSRQAHGTSDNARASGTTSSNRCLMRSTALPRTPKHTQSCTGKLVAQSSVAFPSGFSTASRSMRLSLSPSCTAAEIRAPGSAGLERGCAASANRLHPPRGLAARPESGPTAAFSLVHLPVECRNAQEVRCAARSEPFVGLAPVKRLARHARRHRTTSGNARGASSR